MEIFRPPVRLKGFVKTQEKGLGCPFIRELKYHQLLSFSVSAPPVPPDTKLPINTHFPRPRLESQAVGF